MNQRGFDIPKDRITEFCHRHHIVKLPLFGSVLRDDFGRDSDIDVQVEFEPGQSVGLFGMAGVQMELSEVLGRKVDLRTPQDLSRYFRDEVVQSAEVQYVEG